MINNEKASSFIQLSQLIYQEGLGRDLMNSAGDLKNRMETLSLPTSREKRYTTQLPCRQSESPPFLTSSGSDDDDSGVTDVSSFSSNGLI